MQGPPPPEVLGHEFTRLTRAEIAALLDTIRAGGDALWEAPAHCTGWAVKDAVAHVVGAFDLLGGAARAALAGQPPAYVTPDQAAEQARSLAAQPREQVLSVLDDAAREYADYVDGLDRAALETTVPLPYGTFPVWTVAGVVLDECVIHHWDIRRPREPAAQITPDTVPAMVGFILPAAQMLCLGEKTDGTWQLDVDAPTGGPVTLHVQDGQVSIERGPATSPDVVVAIAGEAFPLLVWGRLDVPAALASGRLRVVAGDRARALALQQMFPGV